MAGATNWRNPRNQKWVASTRLVRSRRLSIDQKSSRSALLGRPAAGLRLLRGRLADRRLLRWPGGRRTDRPGGGRLFQAARFEQPSAVQAAVVLRRGRGGLPRVLRLGGRGGGAE